MNIKQGSTSTNNKIDRSNHASSKTSLSPPSVQTFGPRRGYSNFRSLGVIKGMRRRCQRAVTPRQSFEPFSSNYREATLSGASSNPFIRFCVFLIKELIVEINSANLNIYNSHNDTKLVYRRQKSERHRRLRWWVEIGYGSSMKYRRNALEPSWSERAKQV